MSNLQKLNARGDCGIDQNGITGLNLIELDATCNDKIKNVSFMSNLKKLGASGDCGIDQKSVCGLNLIVFKACKNEKINDVSFMGNLRELDASEDCGIDQRGLVLVFAFLYIKKYKEKRILVLTPFKKSVL